MSSNHRALLSALRGAFQRERLPPPPEAGSSPPHPRGGLMSALFAIEQLPLDAPAAPPRRGAGLLSMLFAIEPLPQDLPAEPRPRGRWLRWLFAPERLDDP